MNSIMQPTLMPTIVRIWSSAMTKVKDLGCLAHHPTLSNIKLNETDVQDIAPLLTIPHLCCIGLWDTPLSEEEVAPLKEYVKGREPVHHDALMDGIDAWVELHSDGKRQVRYVRTGSSYLSQSALSLHFGLGQAEGVTSVEVDWPGGGRQKWLQLPTNRRIQLFE